MKQLVIEQTNIYTMGDNEYFSFQWGNCIYRDVNVKLEKNEKYILEIIAKVCELDWKKLTKKNLVNLIKNSNCLILNIN